MGLATDFAKDAGVTDSGAPTGSLASQFAVDSAGVSPTQAAPVAVKAQPISRIDKVIKGTVDPIEGGAQLLTHILPQGIVDAGNTFNNWLADKTGLVARVPTKMDALVTGGKPGLDGLVQNNENAYQAQRTAAGESGFDGYRLIGNVVSPANLAIAAKGPQAVSLIGKVGAGIINGGASAALNPVVGDGSYWGNKGQQVGEGAAFGAVASPVAHGLARLISPNASTNAELALLKSEGVQPTVGQSLGGWANSLEQKATSIPLVGDAIAAARGNATAQFNTAAINRAVKPIGETVQGTGQAAVADAADKLSQAYTAGKNALGNFAIDKPAAVQFTQLKQMVTALPAKEQGQFQNAWDTFTSQLSPQGHLLPDSFKHIDSKLGADAARFSGSQDAYQQQLGSALKQMQTIITDNAKRANPAAAAALNAADTGYANLVRVEGAAKAAMNTGGVFSPAQLNMAVRQADKSVRGRAVAQGNALMQDLGSAGQNILGNKVPDSGTAGRGLTAGAGAALVGGYAINPMIPIGLLGGTAAYSRPIQGLLSSMVSSRPGFAQPIANSLKNSSSMLAPGIAQIGLGLLN